MFRILEADKVAERADGSKGRFYLTRRHEIVEIFKNGLL